VEKHPERTAKIAASPCIARLERAEMHWCADFRAALQKTPKLNSGAAPDLTV
jgi:hypothetical protein